MHHGEISECHNDPAWIIPRSLRVLVIVFMFLAALSVRLYHICDPPLEFHPTRQYHSLFTARMFYLKTLTSATEEERQLARRNQRMTGILEPPLMEILATAGYHLVGGEHIWIPRLCAIAFWLIGGVFVFLIATRISSSDAALFSTALYLFLPFGIVASRSFQPDPLMVMLVLAAIDAILRYHDSPSPHRWAAVIAISGIAVLAKPVAFFFLVCTFLSLSLYHRGLRECLKSVRVLAYPAAILLPMALYYLVMKAMGIISPSSSTGRFMPHLIIQRFFWDGWLLMLYRVFGYPLLIAALLGALVSLATGGANAALLAGMWIGYFAYCLTFTYNIHNHDYYHLPLVPIVALSLAPFADLLIKQFRGRLLSVCRIAFATAILLCILVGAHRGLAKIAKPDSERKASAAREVGEMVNHSRYTIFLADAYGKPLVYHGNFCGLNWPHRYDVWAKSLQGVKALTVEEQFRTMMKERRVDFFIITDFEEYSRQPELERFLLSRHPIAKRSQEYLIFDLRRDHGGGN